MAGQLNDFELGGRDLQAYLIGAVEVGRGDFQSGCGRGVANEGQQNQQRAQHMAGPGGGDLAEEPVLNRIPFRGSRWIVADGDLQPAVVREVLQAFLVAS